MNQESMPAAGHPFRLSKPQRLKTGADFERVFAGKTSAADKRLLIYAAENGLNFSRLGVSVGKKWGGAVDRNRHKRRLREAFRRIREKLPQGYDYVLIPRTIETPSSKEYEESLLALGTKLSARRQRRE